VFAGTEVGNELGGKDEGAKMVGKIPPKVLEEEGEGGENRGGAKPFDKAVEGWVSEIEWWLIDSKPEEGEEVKVASWVIVGWKVEAIRVTSLQGKEIKGLTDDGAPRAKVFRGVFSSEAEGAGSEIRAGGVELYRAFEPQFEGEEGGGGNGGWRVFGKGYMEKGVGVSEQGPAGNGAGVDGSNASWAERGMGENAVGVADGGIARNTTGCAESAGVERCGGGESESEPARVRPTIEP
jgi:hypothetical protein